MITKNCAICGKILGRKTLYTCADCKGVWQTKPREERICARLECENIFFVGGNNTKNKKYCSNSQKSIMLVDLNHQNCVYLVVLNYQIEKENIVVIVVDIHLIIEKD